MISQTTLANALDAITEADAGQAAQLVVASLERLGELGRPAAEATLELAQEQQDSPYLEEGFVQISAVEGVIDGRTDSL